MPRPNRGPHLRPGPAGNYYIHWTDAGRSKRSSTGTGDLPSAEKVLGKFLLLDDRERAAGQDGGALMVLAALGDEHIPAADYWHEHVIPNVVGVDTIRYSFDKLKAHFGHLAVKDIMPSDVAAYVAKRRAGILGKPSVNHTISRELSVLNAAINHAVKAKRLPRSEQPFIKLPGTSPPRDRWLSFDEADALLSAALQPVDPHTPKDTLPRVYRFIALALNTASRKSALLGLTRGQVDMAGGMIHLNPAGRQQTKKHRPRVPISDALRPILDRILREIPDRPDALLLDHDGELRTAFGGAVVRAGLGGRRGRVRKEPRPYKARTKKNGQPVVFKKPRMTKGKLVPGSVQSDVTPHVLRHTKATWMAQAGVSMFDIAGVLGDSVETVTKTYAHHHPDYLRAAINTGRRAA